MEPITYVLYGHTDRDRDELVCQFFGSEEDRDQFVFDLPGTYEQMILIGVDNSQFGVEAMGSYDGPS